MNQFLKSIGSLALGVAGFVAIIAVIFLLVQGGAWMADKVYPILIVLFLLALVITVLIFAACDCSEDPRLRWPRYLYHVICLRTHRVGLESSPHLYALGRLWRRHRHSHGGRRHCPAVSRCVSF